MERLATFRRKADAIGQMGYEKIDGSYMCTGTLLNVSDTLDVFEPYFLTANHCVETDIVAATVEVAWFWQTATCNSADLDPRLTFSFKGTEVLATSRAQDSTLLQLKETLPGGLLLSAWSTRIVSNGTDVFSVRHPNGFAVQFSEGQVLRTMDANVDGNIVYDAIETNWSRGLTEGGRSGAGLFTTSGGYLVGVLSGGIPNCSTIGDVFGSFHDFLRKKPRPSSASAGNTHSLD